MLSYTIAYSCISLGVSFYKGIKGSLTKDVEIFNTEVSVCLFRTWPPSDQILFFKYALLRVEGGLICDITVFLQELEHRFVKSYQFCIFSFVKRIFSHSHTDGEAGGALKGQ